MGEADDIKNGVCEWCGSEGDVYTDNDRCEQCDSDIVHCLICDQDQHRDDLCRHVSQDINYEWFGAGVGPEPTPAARRSFMALLNRLPKAFSKDLRKAIRAQKFHTWMVAPLIGGGGHLTLYGMLSSDWGGRLVALGESDEVEALHDGYRWLASLYDDRTPEANATTLAMIRERLSASPAAAGRRALASEGNDG